MKKRSQKGMIAAALAAPAGVKKKLAPEIEHRVQPASLRKLGEIHPYFPRVKIEPPPLDYDPDYEMAAYRDDVPDEPSQPEEKSARATWLDAVKPNDDVDAPRTAKDISAVNSDDNGIYRFFRNG
jgi:hypothetical protein